MKQQYGASMIQCLKTVMPVARRIKPVIKREIRRLADPEDYSRILENCRRRHQTARVRLLEGIPEYGAVPYEEILTRLHLTASVVRAMADAGAIAVEEKSLLRGPAFRKDPGARQTLTADQDKALAEICGELFEEEAGQPAADPADPAISSCSAADSYAWRIRRDKRPCLLHGITGSGKTLIYMELIEKVQKMGLQTIVLIPEIALTWQTVLRFWQRFGDRVSFINSRLSQGERYDQFRRAKEGEIDIMIGPRSAVFTPFQNLGLIIIDEEHESAYKS
ncbi:MAG: DEAD/DEAH box helicase family protein, partial [Lachnospiraceae bacterium]|nr:DEAD/DEAH box helicase family protein [Lachnospiraceae bacterium]